LDAHRRHNALNHNGGSVQKVINIARWFTHCQYLRDTSPSAAIQLRSADFADSPFHCGRKRSDNRRNQRYEIGKPIRWRDEQEHGDRKFGQMLLKRQIAIDGNQDVELGLSQREQLAVLNPRPAHLGHCSNR